MSSAFAKPTIRGRSAFAIVGALLAGLTAIFLIPFFVPVNDGFSLSYILGFSNRAAMVLLVCVTFLFGLWSRGLGFSLPDQAQRGAPLSRRTGVVAIAGSLLACLLVWFCSQPSIVLGEANFFLDRLEMFRLGGNVYRDFGFEYGLVMFYMPVWISRLTGVSLGNSYFIAWTLQWLAGTWLLWKVIQVAARGTAHGRTIFLLLWAFWLEAIIDSGSNYTPLRFCLILWVALAVHRLYVNGASLFSTFGTLTCGTIAAFLFSPEQGLCLLIGTLLFFFACVRRRRPGTVVALVSAGLLMGFLLTFAFKARLLDSLLAFGTGTMNFPLLFSFQSAVLVILLIVAGCVAIAAFRSHESQHPIVYLICLSLVGLPAAFGRADLGHIIINSLGALIASLVILGQYRALWRWAWPAFAIAIFLIGIGHFTAYRPLIASLIENGAAQGTYPAMNKACTALLSIMGRQEALARVSGIEERKADFEDPTTKKLPPHARLIAPVGFPRRIHGLEGDPWIISGRHAFLYPIYGPEPAQDKISELQAHPEESVILPTGMTCEGSLDNELPYMKRLLLVPYMPPARNRPHSVKPLCTFIEEHYTLSDYAAPIPGWAIWVPKT